MAPGTRNWRLELLENYRSDIERVNLLIEMLEEHRKEYDAVIGGTSYDEVASYHRAICALKKHRDYLSRQYQNHLPNSDQSQAGPMSNLSGL